MSKVNRNEFAEILGKSPKWIGELINLGMPHKGGGGRGKAMTIDTQEAIEWLIEKKVREQVGEVEDENRKPQAGTKEGEDILLTQAKRRKAEVEADKAESSSMDLTDLAQFLYAIGTLVGNELNGLGARLGSEVAAIDEPAKCKHLIDQEGRRIRAATADQILAFVDEYLRKHGRDGESQTDEERGSMGD